MFEAKAERKLRTWQMVNRMYAKTIVSAVDGSNQEYLPLPADYLQLKRARVTDAPCAQDPLEYASPDYIDTLQRDNVTGGVPTAYSIVGQALRLGPIPDKQYTIEIMYYAKIPKLSSSVPTSWLLADHPDLYLYGALLNASPYMKDDERIPIWQGIVEGEDSNGGIFEDIRIANERAEHDPGSDRARPPHAAPTAPAALASASADTAKESHVDILLPRNNFLLDTVNGAVTPGSASYAVMLVTDSYVPTKQTDHFRSDVLLQAGAEVAASGYTAGGTGVLSDRGDEFRPQPAGRSRILLAQLGQPHRSRPAGR